MIEELEVKAVNLGNYLRSFYYKEQQKPGSLGDLAPWSANGKDALGQKDLMSEERRLNF